MENEIIIREIKRIDNLSVANLIRSVMIEWGAVGEGFSIEDPEVDNMFEAYATPLATFLVVESDGEIVGCGGFAALKGGDSKTCELRKMYFYPQLRGQGVGLELLQKCLAIAKKMGFTQCYLESCRSMEAAVRLYKKNGFEALDLPMGNTGHSGCDVFFVKALF